MLAGLTQGTHYSDVKRFNATTQAWESYAGSAFTQFEPGKGYNIIGLTSASFSYGKTETTTTFVYDATGQRVKKTAGGTTTTYLGKDYDVTGSTSAKYIFLGDRRLATKDSTGVLQFTHDDHISSSNIITDSSGNQAGLLEYDPYGSTVTQTGASNPKHKFTGQEEDSSTRLYYYNARYYDPQLGRFITPDWHIQAPRDPQSFNRYAYARNNPIKFTDPTGNFAFFAFLAFVGKVAAVVAGVTAVASMAAQALGASRLANVLAKVSMIASFISMGANGVGALFAPGGSPQASIQIATQNPELKIAEPATKAAAKETARDVFRQNLKEQIKNELNDLGGRVIENALFSRTAHAAESVPTSGSSSTSNDSWFRVRSFDPNYGNWGGSEWSGGRTINSGQLGDVNVPAVDSLDEVYKTHDVESYYSGAGQADENLVRSLNVLSDNPSKWVNQPRNKLHAVVHKNMAESYFKKAVNARRIAKAFKNN